MNATYKSKQAPRSGVSRLAAKRRASLLLAAALAGVLVPGVPAAFGQAQALPAPLPPPPGAGPLRVFIDCPLLDPVSFVQDKPYLALVKVPQDAQVNVQVTTKKVEGQDVYTVRLTGQHEFSGLRDELPVVTEPGRSPEEIGKELGQTIQLGLMRYVSRLPLGERVRVSLMDQVSPTAVVDPWHFWVFSLSASAFLSGQESYLMQMYYGNFSASRVTPEWKVRLTLNGIYEKDHFDYQGYVYDSYYNTKKASGLVVKSLNDHWSVGVDCSVLSSSFSNLSLAYGLAPGIEYDVFPYSESTKRGLRLLYRLGIQRTRYVDETIYDKTAQTLWQQVLSATLELNRPWGTVSTTLEGANYLHDFSKYHIQLSSDVSFRIFQGLSFNLNGGATWIHDQVYLAKGGASFEDVILQRKLLATSYQLFFMVGLKFSFGSLKSNVVNPRFGGSGGGTSISISI